MQGKNDWPDWDDEDKKDDSAGREQEQEFDRSRSPRHGRRPTAGLENEWFRQAMLATVASTSSSSLPEAPAPDSQRNDDGDAGANHSSSSRSRWKDSNTSWSKSWDQSNKGDASTSADGWKSRGSGNDWRSSEKEWSTSWNRTGSRGKNSWSDRDPHIVDEGDADNSANRWNSSGSAQDWKSSREKPSDWNRNSRGKSWSNRDSRGDEGDASSSASGWKSTGNDWKSHGEKRNDWNRNNWSKGNRWSGADLHGDEGASVVEASEDVEDSVKPTRKAAPKRTPKTPKSLSELRPDEVPEEVQQLRVGLQLLEERASLATDDSTTKARYDEKIKEAYAMLQDILIDHNIFDEAIMKKFEEADDVQPDDAEHLNLLRFEGFQLHHYLNTTFSPSHKIKIGGNRTYWSPGGDFFMFFSASFSRWQICSRWAPSPDGLAFDLLPEVQNGKNLFIAYEEIDEDGQCRQWAELVHETGRMIGANVQMIQELAPQCMPDESLQEMDVSDPQVVTESNLQTASSSDHAKNEKKTDERMEEEHDPWADKFDGDETATSAVEPETSAGTADAPEPTQSEDLGSSGHGSWGKYNKWAHGNNDKWHEKSNTHDDKWQQNKHIGRSNSAWNSGRDHQSWPSGADVNSSGTQQPPSGENQSSWLANVKNAIAARKATMTGGEGDASSGSAKKELELKTVEEWPEDDAWIEDQQMEEVTVEEPLPTALSADGEMLLEELDTLGDIVEEVTVEEPLPTALSADGEMLPEELDTLGDIVEE